MEKNIFLFTGQSGIKTDEAVKKLARHCEYMGKKVEVIKFEPFFKEEYVKANPYDDAELVNVKGGYLRLLRRPKPLLKEIWRAAFIRFSSKIDETPKENVFIIMHAVFYHQLTREFFSCLDLTSISKVPIKKVITLIDDIYDIYLKLREPHEMYNDYLCYMKQRPPAFKLAVDSVLNLLNILDWRSIEIAVSEFIADSINRPHYLLAVKHSVEVGDDLLFSEKTPYYVSHPITAVRELLNRKEIDEATVIQNEISTLIHELQRNENILLFSPTTIDELRIQKNASGEYIPKLGERWHYDAPEGLLFVPPKKGSENPLDPARHFDEERPELKVISSLLSVLVEKISKQISSRDYKLVEQCQGLFVYRPYFRGRDSTGVDSEVQFNSILSKKSPKLRHAFVFNKPEDIASVKIRRAFGRGVVQVPPPIETVMKFISDEAFRKELINNSLSTTSFQKIAEKYEYEPEFDLEKISSPFSGDPTGAGVEKAAVAWEEATKRVNSAGSVPLKEWVRPDEWFVDDMRPQVFLNKCFQLLKA